MEVKILNLFLLLLGIVCRSCDAQEPPDPEDCYLDSAGAPNYQNVVYADNSTLTPLACCDTCLSMVNYYCALSEALLCQCAMTLTGTVSTGLCSATCPGDPLQVCGAIGNPGLYFIYNTGFGDPVILNLLVDDATDPLKLIVTFDYAPKKEIFQINFGDGAPNAIIDHYEVSVGPYFATFDFPAYTLGGTYTITVLGSIMLTSVTATSTFATPIVKENAAEIQHLSCPQIVFADETYSCTVIISYKNPAHQYLVTFDDLLNPPITLTLSSIGNSVLPVGIPVPKAKSVSEGGVTNAFIIMKNYPILYPSELIAVELTAGAIGTVEAFIYRAACSIGDEYCAIIGTCLPIGACPYNSQTYSITCSLPDAFCHIDLRCCNFVGLLGTNPTYNRLSIDVVQAAGEDNVGMVIFPSIIPYQLYPGDLLAIDGTLSYRDVLITPGDLVDNVLTNKHHYARMIVKEILPLQIPFTCINVLQNVTMDVTDLSIPLTVVYPNAIPTTICERNITDFEIDINQTETDSYNATFNLASPYYVWVGKPFSVMNMFSVGGPITFNLTFNNSEFVASAPNPVVYLADYNATASGPFMEVIIRTITLTGLYTLQVDAYNQHNTVPDPNTGLIRGPLTRTLEIYALYPVSPDWKVAPDPRISQYNTILVPTSVPNVWLFDTLNMPFPSSATIRIDWGDGTAIEQFSFIDTGTQKEYSHSSYVAGVYNINCSITNLLSATYHIQTQMTIYEQIINFVVTPMYFPAPSLSAKNGFGRNENLFPSGKNLTFFPSLSYGTVDRYELHFTNNGSFIASFPVADMYNPTVDFFYHFFGVREIINLTITAINIHEQVPYQISVELVTLIRGLVVDDRSIVTTAGQVKWFDFTFVSEGVDTCLVIDFGDNSDYLTIGNENMCKQNFSHAVYDPIPLVELAMNFSHTYNMFGIFNVTAFAYNDIGKDDYTLMFVVSSVSCTPPYTTVINHVVDHYSSVISYRGEQNVAQAIGVIGCGETTTTKKRWQIFKVDEIYGSRLYPIYIMDVIPSWDKPELFIPPNFLDYGYYLCLYSITMWDDPDDPTIENPLDPELPFQTLKEHFILIEKSALVTKMTGSGATTAIRGLEQELFLEPAVHSYDPDYPDVKNFTIKWRCKALGEEFLKKSLEFPTSIGVTTRGCFGHEPGYFYNPSRELDILGKEFIGLGKFVIEAQIRKDTRLSSRTMILEIVADDVPVLETRCSSKKLCVPHKDGIGVLVNPNERMAVVTECLLACDAPLIYEWELQDILGVVLILAADETPLGSSSMQYSLPKIFFDRRPTLREFFLISRIINSAPGGSTTGESIYHMKINQRPSGGDCTLDKFVGKALVEIFLLQCFQWTDPERKGILHYTIRLYEAGQTPLTLMEERHKFEPIQAMELILPVGTFQMRVSIEDFEGGVFYFDFAPTITVNTIPITELDAFNSANKINLFVGGGDINRFIMMINARNSIINQEINVNDPTLTKQQQDDLLLYINEINIHSVAALYYQPSYMTVGRAEAVLGVIAEIMLTTSSTPDNTLALDMFTKEDILEILEKSVQYIEQLDVPSPEDLEKLMESVATIAAGLVTCAEEMASADCDRIGPYDIKNNADKVSYDTRVVSLEMELHETEEMAKACNMRDLLVKASHVQMERLDKIMKNMSRFIIDKLVPGEKIEVSTNNNMTVTAEIMKENQGLPGTYYCGKSFVTFPNGLCPQGNCSYPVAVSFREWPTVTFIEPISSSYLTAGSRVFDIEVYEKNGKPLEVNWSPSAIIVSLYRTVYKRENNTASTAEFIEATYETQFQRIPIVYSKFDTKQIGAGVMIEIEPTVALHDNLFLMVMQDRQPTLQNHDIYTLVKDIPIKQGNVYEMFIPSENINGRGSLYIGVGEYIDTVTAAEALDPVLNNAPPAWLKKPMTINYYLQVLTTACYSYSHDKVNWTLANMKVMNSDNINSPDSWTVCHADHLTSFAAGLFICPNTIDFSYVFANIGFSDNHTIFLTLGLTFLAFLGMMLWALYKDKQDKKLLGASPLPDNLINDKYLYEILVFTGNHKEAQTDSTVQFILSGDYGDTEIRTFGDDERRIFRKAGTDVFIMAVPDPLGPLSYLRIWHDNTGRGPNASWFFSYIVFKDVQTGLKYEFINNEWMAVERGDGQVEKLIGVAGRDQKNDFGHMFHNTSNRNLVDGHLWFSVFLRPARSRFTRCQRVACCFALLFLSMLVNAMWYNRIPSKAAAMGFTIGPFTLSPEQLAIGMISNFIIFPPTLLIVFLFRRARPRVLRKSRIEGALHKASKKAMKNKYGDEWEEYYLKEIQEQKEIQRELQIQKQIEKRKCLEQKERDGYGESEATHNRDRRRKRKRNRRFTLPFWCQYVAWGLVVLFIALSVFFVLMYAVMFGNEKATKWVTALIISFFSSILFVQPMKVFLTAVFFSLVCKSNDLDEDDADEDEEIPKLEDDELWLFSGQRSNRMGYSKLSGALLEELRNRRQKEAEMWRIIIELISYSFFIWTLLILSFGQRDPNSWYLQNNLKQSFIHPGAADGTDFSIVGNIDSYWYYLHNGLFSDLRADVWYNGKPPYLLRGYLNDYVNRIMGYATIRQIRAKQNSCSIHGIMQNTSYHCAGYSNLDNEESRHYCAGWQIPNTKTKKQSTCRHPEFRYETAERLQNLPVYGKRDSYGGGGYVIHMSAPTEDILERFKFLQENHWIDKMTRAVLIEFSTYNSQVNLFGINTIVAEITPGGGVTPYYRFDVIRLLQHHDNFGSFVILCECIFVGFLIYFTVHELGLLWHDWKKYFESYWSYAELSIISVSYAAIAVYWLRYFETIKSLKTFKETHGNGYVKITYAAQMDEIYGYMLGFMVFVGTIKFIKLLRFNKRIGVLSETLSRCWDDLQGFLMAFVICFFSFVIMFFVLLQSHIEGFAKFITALETSFSMMMGKFDFDKMRDVNPVVPIMFFVFVLCTSWILINLLLTLIIQSFEEVKNDIMNQPNEYEMVQFVFGKFKKFLGLSATSGGPIGLGKGFENVVETRANDYQTENTVVNTDVNDLPNKVDKFLDYMNATYFDGTMDFKSKRSMAESFKRSRPVVASEGDQPSLNYKDMLITPSTTHGLFN